MRRIDTVSPTLHLQTASQADWELIVVGAGPAGATAAREASRQGIRVLLLDRDNFPRRKVCGCCISPAALGLLNSAGLGHLPQDLRGKRLTEFRLAASHNLASVPLAGGIALSREQLDAALIQAAIDSGSAYLDSTQAVVRPGRSGCLVVMKQQGPPATATARAVIVASGLGSRSIEDGAGDERRSSRRSRIGAGAVCSAPDADYHDGTIYMACHQNGYVGLVRLEDRRLDLATALDVSAVKKHGGVAATVLRILKESGLPPVDGLEHLNWRGTAKLTQRRTKLFGEGFLVVGDAAGYVEPFTGEGIAWAMATGRAAVPFALQAMRASTTDVGPAWSREYRRVVGHRMRVCRTISFFLRQPRLMKWTTWALARRPQLAQPLVRSLNAPFAFVLPEPGTSANQQPPA
jgi:flavin-dependent dehydrogenase